MSDKMILILKPGGDLFFAHHVVKIFGIIPGQERQLWHQEDITYLPITVVVPLPDSLRGNFGVRCEIYNKFSGTLSFKSHGTWYLETKNLSTQNKTIPIRRATA
ncbi:unnamed protein product [Rotaria sp. Silwood2]|nr:unnamed protein product [Rotaria sp. Silwood2]CAF4628528.1 unnamed protein product [Rotaria sp. Silwood2]